MSDTFNKNYINSTLHQFDIACKNFTTIMAIKHQLQHSIFNGICSIDSVLSGLVVTLSYLQTLADIIQEVKVDREITLTKLSNMSCHHSRKLNAMSNASSLAMMNTG